MNAKISAKMIAHSISPEGKELLSIEVIAPYFLDAEIEKHGMLCVAGDTVIEFDLHAKSRNYKQRKFSKTIEYLSDRWHKKVRTTLRREDISNMDIRVLDVDKNEIVSSSIVDIYDNGEKEVFTIITSEGEITATDRHHFLNEDSEWIELKNLKVGDFIRKRAFGVHDYKVSKRTNELITWQRGIKNTIITHQNNYCSHCNNTLGDTAELHHTLPVHSHPELMMDVNNVVAVHEECHKELHKTQGWQVSQKLVSKPVQILDIVNSGLKKVYDLQVEHPDHNYIGNGFVIHNCSNSSSNRAIPFKTMSEAPYYIPTDIRKNQKGMQGFEKVNGFDLHPWIEGIQEIHDKTAIILNTINDELDVHKQHLNRYLAPFSMQKKIMTGTREAWNGVMMLRDHPDADPSIQIWAKEIHNLLRTSKPMQLAWDEWHLPYITEEEMALPLSKLLIMSTARCARTSQRLHDGKATSFEADKRTYHMLIDSNPMHETPLEHQAMCTKKPTNIYNSNSWLRGQTHIMKNGDIGSGRLIGWIQHRHWLEK